MDAYTKILKKLDTILHVLNAILDAQKDMVRLMHDMYVLKYDRGDEL